MDSPAVAEESTPPNPPDLPNISDYWPDAPQSLGPPADHYELPGVDATRTGPAWHVMAGASPPGAAERVTVEIPSGVRPHRSTAKRAVILAALLAVGAVAAWAVFRPASDEPRQPVFAGPVASPAPAAAAPVNPPVSIGTPPPSTVPVPDAATFEFADNTTELTVTIGAVDNGWFRVTTPRDSGVRPRTSLDGDTLRVGIEPTGEKGTGRIDVLLSEEVDWAVRTRGGFRTATLDLTRGTVDRIDLLGGMARLNLALPARDAALPIVLSGGVNQWRISTEGKVPVRAVFRRGAGRVILYGDRRNGLRRDAEVSTGRDAEVSTGRGAGGIDLNAEEGVGTLTVVAR
ncbi:hypothetical protein OHA21_25190 [Actinoplanes sp. NBC_00393]|uniref:hypothetical protein n=1 Tax=Actinoplanes sp. NBC_00393 TaxID=2975953 RepID=UPI002E1C7A3D